MYCHYRHDFPIPFFLIQQTQTISWSIWWIWNLKMLFICDVVNAIKSWLYCIHWWIGWFSGDFPLSKLKYRMLDLFIWKHHLASSHIPVLMSSQGQVVDIWQSISLEQTMLLINFKWRAKEIHVGFGWMHKVTSKSLLNLIDCHSLHPIQCPRWSQTISSKFWISHFSSYCWNPT